MLLLYALKKLLKLIQHVQWCIIMIKREALSGKELCTYQFSEEQVNNSSINYGTVDKACISYKKMKRQTFKMKRN